LEKGNLAGKNLLFKRLNLLCKGVLLFDIGPIIQIKIIFVAGKTKKYRVVSIRGRASPVSIHGQADFFSYRENIHF
jgi:hypothetical protein